jgi:hypothetical protein|tara:strand:+ start:643 stop:1188 length:546 start_codon:yes stop_codon:yes gene_type:complete
MLKLDGKTLQYDKAFVHDGQQYPSNWLRLTSLEEKQAIGITEVADPVKATYDQRFYWGVDNPKQLNDKPAVDKDGNELGYTQTGLKTLWKATQDEMAASLLSPSDWRVVKAAEVTDYAVSSQWLTYRAAVRTACNARQAEIDACETVDALKELLFGSAQIEKDGEMIANPAIATAWPTPIK